MSATDPRSNDLRLAALRGLLTEPCPNGCREPVKGVSMPPRGSGDGAHLLHAFGQCFVPIERVEYFEEFGALRARWKPRQVEQSKEGIFG